MPHIDTSVTTSTPPAHHRPGGGYRNPWPGAGARGFKEFLGWMFERARRGRFGPPAAPAALPLATPDLAAPRAAADDLRITAIGHSSFLIQLGPLNILTDPVFSARCSPVQWAGPRRRQPPGIAPDALPPIDVVLQSHDHYDHFDDASVRALATRHPEALWCAPLGVSARLKARGVRHVAELDWWEGFSHGAAEITCMPAAHFSGRTPFDRDDTLWCGWTVAVAKRQVYFAGDTGHHPDFATIGARLGPCDAILLPVGAYEPRWFMRPVHMDPEEAVEAFGALTAMQRAHPTVMVAMHWGTFVLTDEPPDEPPARARAAWSSRGWPEDRLWVLSPGETRRLAP